MSPAERCRVSELALAIIQADGDGDAAERAAFEIIDCVTLGEAPRRMVQAVLAAFCAGIVEGRALARRQHAEDLLEQARSFE